MTRVNLNLPLAPKPLPRSIHLLYVPTLFCNLSCSYCYLGKQTETAPLRDDIARASATLQTALQKLEAAGVLAFNVSLHGGEVTTLPVEVLRALFATIREHYRRNHDAISALGHHKTVPHIKTNLYRLTPLLPLLEEFKVSISASIDLPLALHGKHRLTRRNTPWLERTHEHLRLLARYPHGKKISTTISREHLAHPQALIDDIWFIHRELGFDMTNFNLMFAFPSKYNSEHKGEACLTPVTEAEQLDLHARLHQAFVGTELEEGLRRHWFDEFTPSYCTSAFNCGERFYLMQSDGEVYSCVRGQGMPEFRYGNLLTDEVDQVLRTGGLKIAALHQRMGFDPACQTCAHLHLCRTGCSVVKLQQATAKSYTCQLQKTLYADKPLSWPALEAPAAQAYAQAYAARMHPGLALSLGEPPPSLQVPAELSAPGQRLRELIAKDTLLGAVYDANAFALELEGTMYPLVSPLLRGEREFVVVRPDTQAWLLVRRDVLSLATEEPIRNTVYIQVLRDRPVVYGDDQRTKQEHVFTNQLFAACLTACTESTTHLRFNIGPLLRAHAHAFDQQVANNLLVTTSALRDYHYNKQRQNAFYHIQAINLPFPNIEFYYHDQGPA